MLTIILIILLNVVFNLYEERFDLPLPNNINYFLRKNKNEFIIIAGDYSYYVIKKDLKNNSFIIIDSNYFDDPIKQFNKLDNNLTIYIVIYNISIFFRYFSISYYNR